METLFVYLIKASGLIALFYLTYYFLLRKETFFTGNRWFLLAGLFTSVLLPLLFFTKTIWVEPTPVNFDWTKVSQTPSIENETTEINWYLVLGIAYALGILTLLAKFAFDFFSLTKVLKGKTIQRQADFKFIDLPENVAPFSYFQYIVYNSSLYSPTELENILEHEKIHSEQNHTIDVLISRVFCILFWYNPFIWWYKKAMLQNLEFIADNEASKKISDKKSYQITLLKITTHENCVAITNHFYQSLIKKRIVMLNKNQSKKWNSWKYATVIPVLAAFVLLFQIKVIAQEKVTVIKTKEHAPTERVIVVIDKNSSNEAMKNDASNLKKKYGIALNISKVKRNDKGEITGIKVDFKDKKGNTGVNQVNGDKPIKPITMVMNMDENGNNEIGFYTNNNDVVVNINKEDLEKAIHEKVVIVEKPDVNVMEWKTDPKDRTVEKEIVITKSDDGSEKPIIFINGEKMDMDMEELSEIDPEIIETMNISEGEHAVEVYGTDGKKRVYSINTRKNLDRERESFARARVEIERSRPEMERAVREMELSKPQMEAAKAEMMKAKEEMVKAKVEMQKAKAEMQKAKAELAKQKK